MSDILDDLPYSPSNGVNRYLLPCFCLPKPDELLSSWLVRLAHRHLMKAHSFCQEILPGIAIWNRDIDKLAPKLVLDVLAKRTPASYEQIFNTTLAQYEGRAYLRHNPYGNTNWILPLGVYHRQRLKYGLVFCPSCLKKDADEPYYRTRWRLAFSVVCLDCEVYLQDRCPNCKQGIHFVRTEMGHKTQLPNKSINHCYNCNYNLAESPVQQAPERSVRRQRMLYRILREGWHKQVVYPHLFFNVLHHLLKILTSKDPRYQLIQTDLYYRRFGMACPQRLKKNTFEELPVESRAQLLDQALWLLQDWPSRFIAVCNYHQLHSMELLKDFNDPPFWYESVVRDYLFISNINRWFIKPAPERIKTGYYQKVAPIQAKRGTPRKYSSKWLCDRCGSNWVIKNGERRGRQCLICNDCNHCMTVG